MLERGQIFIQASAKTCFLIMLSNHFSANSKRNTHLIVFAANSKPSHLCAIFLLMATKVPFSSTFLFERALHAMHFQPGDNFICSFFYLFLFYISLVCNLL